MTSSSASSAAFFGLSSSPGCFYLIIQLSSTLRKRVRVTMFGVSFRYRNTQSVCRFFAATMYGILQQAFGVKGGSMGRGEGDRERLNPIQSVWKRIFRLLAVQERWVISDGLSRC